MMNVPHFFFFMNITIGTQECQNHYSRFFSFASKHCFKTSVSSTFIDECLQKSLLAVPSLTPREATTNIQFGFNEIPHRFHTFLKRQLEHKFNKS